MKGFLIVEITILAIGTAACGGNSVGSSVESGSAPPTTTNAISANNCQFVNGKWVTNDSATSTTPCVPDPSFATGDVHADEQGVLPRCRTCKMSDWDRAERQATDRSASSTSASTSSAASSRTSTPTPPPTFSAKEATDYFRGYVDEKFNGTAASGDGRGCVKLSAAVFSCTAYVRGSNIDVIGSVNVASGAMIPDARMATGSEITAWFQQTGGTNF